MPETLSFIKHKEKKEKFVFCTKNTLQDNWKEQDNAKTHFE